MANPALGTLEYLLAKNGKEFVQACYQEVLHRDADEAGLQNHLEALHNGTSKAHLVASFVNSDEACLNSMSTSRLAIAARQKDFLDRRNVPWPLRGVLVNLNERRQRTRLIARRATLLREAEAVDGAAPSQVPAVEVERVPIAAWQAAIGAARDSSTPENNGQRLNNLWFDLTTALQWNGGVVGIVRAELELACGFSRIYPNIRFSMQVDQGFAEITKAELRWLLDAENVADAYMRFFARYKGTNDKPQAVHAQVPNTEGFFHPYEKNDAIVAVGWMDSQKERYFSKIKQDIPELYLFYLVYDIILLLEDTCHFYDRSGRDRFKRYIEWISYHCDMVLYGGSTAQHDTEKLQSANGWPTPPAFPLKFGTDIVKASDSADEVDLLRSLGITGPFVICVGSLEPRKNHETLYRAYLMALELAEDVLPQLVIVGKPMWRVDDLLDTIKRHPKLKGKILCLTPTDMELAALYKNCRFTLLPSLYEGWSLTLPESLGQGKFCLCADTPPLREIGGNLVDYVETFDVRAWAEKIIEYSFDDELLRRAEKRIVEEWPETKWSDTAKMAIDAIFAHAASQSPVAINLAGQDTHGDWTAPPATIWMDLTSSFIDWRGGISGIVRAELEYAKRLKELDPRTRFFAYQHGHDYFFEIEPGYLIWLFDGTDLSEAYRNFHNYWKPHEEAGNSYRNPFYSFGKPIEGHSAYLPEIPANSVVFFAGIDSDGSGTVHRTKKIDSLISPGKGIVKSQLIYDLTPVLYPQFHTPETCKGFGALFEHVSKSFDHVVYGGRTAQRDGIEIQSTEHWPVPASDFVEFGSDINPAAEFGAELGKDEGERILRGLGITGDFAMTIGTIEPRKNHEALYKAYLMMLKKSLLENPLQIVFVGKKGWKSDDFLATLEQDQRVKGKIIIISPSDKELDVLYRSCRFTLLPSFYEGWSLTLPESLSYGKFCIASDVDPLRETGGDLVEYVHPLDTARWAERIAFYANNSDELRSREARIAEGWKTRTWRESAEMLLGRLYAAHRRNIAADVVDHLVDGKE